MTRVAECPVEGCTYGESDEKTEAQVRGHMASIPDHPNPTEYDGVIPLRQSQPPEETDDQETDQDDQDDQDDDTQEMPTDDEYKAQNDSIAAGTQESQEQKTESKGSSFDVEKLGLSDDLLLLVVGVAVAGGLTYLVISGDSKTQAVETDDQDETGTVAETPGLVNE